MWMVRTDCLCRNHLLGEHKELHQAVGSIRNNRSLAGHIARGQVEVHNIRKRHTELVKELKKRGYKHQSPLKNFKSYKAGKINILENYQVLEARCKECSKRIKNSKLGTKA